MKVIYSEDFNDVYASDPAAAAGRIRAVELAIKGRVTFVEPKPATKEDILRVHTPEHVKSVEREGVYEIAALAAGGAIRAAEIGLSEPCFALIRPPGHHASANSAWGFCYFNNMAIALEKLRHQGKIKKAFILDFDLHYGDGNVNILGTKGYATIYNPATQNRNEYLKKVQEVLAETKADMIAASAGFDNHEADWGGLLKTEDYTFMGRLIRETAQRNNGGCFGILEGGYNHSVLGKNVLAFINGLEVDI
ncbi:MAG TPA: histone deacetylase family protein [Smithellaceae bacterium]|nr:histone deacetylase family protein [Smithellaceae bacterium]HRS88896.1 histone deacetylase family protein [Smithellaceae bacterium]HRV26235.1 histone deacetylase family protein [Smithellaceae bacterium]